MISDWVREITKSRGESVCVGGGLRCKFSFVKVLSIFFLHLQDRNMNRSTFNDGFYFSTSCQDHRRAFWQGDCASGLKNKEKVKE